MNTLFSHLSPHRSAALAWIHANPDVLLEMERIALIKADRKEPVSIDAIGHIIRWERRFDWSGDHKVNNSHLSTIADMLIEKHPHLAEFIERRARGGQIRRAS